MKRLVATNKINIDAIKKQETETTNPPSETAVPVGTTSPIASRPKSYRRRINRMIPSSEETTEVAPPSPTRNSAAITNNDEVTKPTTSSKPSPHRVRQHMRSANSNGNSNIGADSPSASQSSGKKLSSNRTNDDNRSNEAPSRDSWMALAKDSDSEKNNSDSVNDGDAGDEVFEQASVTMQVQSSESPTQGSIPWDERREPSISMTSSPIRNMLLEKENVERELADVRMDRDILRQQLSEARIEFETDRSSLRGHVADLKEELRSLQQSEQLADVQMDRDILRQQLSKARTELEIARSSLRENVADLEDQLRSLRQSQRRQTELEENALLEKEIDELTRLTREQEEKKAAAELAAAAAVNQRDTAGNTSDHDGSKDSAELNDGITFFTDGAAASSIDPTGLTSPASYSIIHVDEGKIERNASTLPSQKERSYKERVVELEDGLKERTLQEEILEKEVHQLKEQAQVESQKFEEAQRQVRWFQRELQAMFPQEGEASSLSLISSQGDTTGGNISTKNQSDDNENNAAQLKTIMESNIDDKDGDEHISGKSIEGVCYATKEKNSTDECFEKTSNFDSVDPSIYVINESVNQSVQSSLCINVLPPDNSMHHSSNHVKLLHEQRLQLEHRVQELLDETGALRLGQYQHEKQQRDTRVLQLQTELQQQQEQHRLDLVLVERQLTEWIGRSDSFQTNLEKLRIVAEQQNARTRLERQELSQRVEVLEVQKNESKDRLEKNRVGFEHEKGYLKRAMESLEKKLQDTSADTCSNISKSDNGDTTQLEESNSAQTQAVFLKPKISDQDFSRDEEAWNGLLDRIQDLKADRKSRIESECALREQLKNITEQEKETKNQADTVEDRVRVLQTFLDASFSASPEKERELELGQEYFSVHSRTRGKDDNNQEEFHEIESESAKTTDIAISSDSTKSIQLMEDGIFPDVQQNTSKSARDPDHKLPQESRAHVLKSRDTEEQLINSGALVHNLHLKLEEEMGNLKKRKERRRSRAMSIALPSDQCVGPFRPLLDPTVDFLHLETKTSDPNAEKAPADISASHTEIVATTNKLLSTDSQLNSEQTRLSTEYDCGNDKKEDFKLKLEEKSKADDEFRKTIEEEKSRLVSALEAVNYSKAQLEIELQDAMKQINDSVDQIGTLSAEIMECHCSLKQSESGKNELMEQIEILRNEAAILKSNVSEKEKEKELFEATLSKLKADLDERDRMILENDESHRMKLEEMKKALDESREAIEEDHTNVDRIHHLEDNILLIKIQLKANMERLSNQMGSVIEERNAVEFKFHDASKQLEECKQNESSLKEAAQENIEKLESALDEFRKLSQTKEHENAGLEKTILENNECIVDLQKDLSCKGRRLEQASTQLSELENELFERDEEIEKLDAKRHQIQDNASKELVNMEKFLEQEGKEIDRLEEEKSKLQDSVQKYEHQIEKQIGRLAEASLQLSELESEIFAKDDEIEEMELRINAMQALEAQRLEILEDSENQKKSLEKQLESAKQTIQSLTSHVDKIKQKREAEKTEAQRLLIEDDKKNKEISSRQNQLNRQLQNVSKLTEQTDKWQLQLEKAFDEKQESLDRLSNVTIELTLLREELEVSNEKVKELDSINMRLKDDLACATEEDEKNCLRISQMEEQKEALSHKLESAVDNLADLQKQNEEARDEEERLSTDIIDKLQSNLQSAHAVDEEIEIHIRKLTEQVEFERRSLRTSESQRSALETENLSLKNQIRLLVEINCENSDADAANDLGNTREQVAKQLTSDLNLTKIR